MKKSVVEVLKDLNPRATLDRKEYADYYKGLAEVLNIVYPIYQAREQGKSTAKLESEAMTKVTEFLHTLGKVNGKYISVCEKTTTKGQTSVLFDTLVYHSFKDRIYTKSATLASLELEKAKASKAKAEAYKKLVDGKGTAKDFKESVKAYDEVVAKIVTERQKAEAEGEMVTRESLGKFQKFATARLKAIINNRYALNQDEADALRKIRNKETKAKRKAQAKTKAEPKAEAKAKAPKTESEAKQNNVTN